MSRENVEIVRSAFEAWNRGDWDAAFKDTAPDFVLDNSRDLGEWRGVHTSPDHVRRVWQRLTEAWESVDYEINELIPAGDRVLSRQTATFCGRGGIEVETRTNWVWTFRDGTVTRLATYPELDEALEAAGLSE